MQNAAFNNRTKEELEMHMFSKCGFSPLKVSSLCGFSNFILTVALATDKKRAGEKDTRGGEAKCIDCTDCSVLVSVSMIKKGFVPNLQTFGGQGLKYLIVTVYLFIS